MGGVVVDEEPCPSPDSNGWHCYCWYEQDVSCCHCGAEPGNLLIIEGGDSAGT